MGTWVIDAAIACWAKRHHLELATSWRGDEVRCAYVSSKAGECFQIWIEPPADGWVHIHAAGVESRRDDHPAEDWLVTVEAFDAALEEVFHTVMAWMLPSERFFPDDGSA